LTVVLNEFLPQEGIVILLELPPFTETTQKMGNRSKRERQVAQHSAEHYRRHRKQLIEKGTVKKEHADSTKENIFAVLTKWTR